MDINWLIEPFAELMASGAPEALIQKFVGWRAVAGYAAMTCREDKRHLEMFAAYLKENGIENIEGITRNILKDFQEYLAFAPNKNNGKFLEATYRNRILGTLRMFFKWLKTEDFLVGNFSEDIVWIKEPRKLPRNILTPEEVAKILELPDMTTWAGYQDRVILELLYGTGIRSAEIRNIKIADLDLNRGYLHIREGKGSKDRVVPLGEGLCRLLAHYLDCVRFAFLEDKAIRRAHGIWGGSAADPANEYLFPGRGKKSFTKMQLWHRVNLAGKKAGLGKRVYAHAFRHACATHMLNNGADLRCVQELLGHTDINSTQVYTHLTITDLKKAHAKYHPREKMVKRNAKLDIP